MQQAVDDDDDDDDDDKLQRMAKSRLRPT